MAICTVCGLPKEICVCEDIARQQQRIVIYTVKRRYGKMVTVAEGFNEADIDVQDLGGILKAKCATGGTAKGSKIELQGNHVKKVEALLIELGFPVEVIKEARP